MNFPQVLKSFIKPTENQASGRGVRLVRALVYAGGTKPPRKRKILTVHVDFYQIIGTERTELCFLSVYMGNPILNSKNTELAKLTWQVLFLPEDDRWHPVSREEMESRYRYYPGRPDHQKCPAAVFD